jgi:putative membrane protein
MHGFLGYDASFMLDVVVCALVLVVPVLLFSLYQVKYRRRYALHRNVQLGLAAVLLLAVAAFEVDLQLVHGGWENVVNKPGAAAPRMTADELARVRPVLWIHLVFAISTPLLWALTITLALRRFPSPPVPGPHSRLHVRLAWASTIDLVLTSVTGLWFYYVAFVAPG